MQAKRNKHGSKTVYYKYTKQCQHLMFCTLKKASAHCHAAKLEPNQGVSSDQVPLSTHTSTCNCDVSYSEPCNIFPLALIHKIYMTRLGWGGGGE